jgi:hypothetical protein
MQKVIKSLVLASILTVMVFPVVALAQPVDQCTLKHDINLGAESFSAGATVCEVGGGCGNETDTWGMFCVLDAIYTVTDWVFFVLIAIAALLVIWGGFTIATAGGNPENVNKGRSYILYAMVGLVVALLSRAIPSIAKALIGA